MSNRFHSKFHRQNHHTYTSGTNPDAGHDPIASKDQPFRGDFVLSGALSCYAGASAVAGFFGTNNTALCAIAGFRGLYVRSPIVGGEFLSTAGNSISAYGALIGGDFYSGIRGIRARGDTYGVDAYSPNIALNASGINIGTSTYSPEVALSAVSPLSGAIINGNNISLATIGNGVNVLKNRTGIQKVPNASYVTYPLTNIVLDINGDVLVEGNTLITGNLSAIGDRTQIDTVIQITSSLRVNNTGSSAAATIVQTGAQPILACYDNEVSLSVPSFIVDGAKNGWVGLGTSSPSAPFTIQKSTATNQSNNQPQIRVTDDGSTNKVSISTPILNFDRSYVGTETNTSFDVVTNSLPRITILAGGNVGIDEINPSAKLSVSGSISGNSTLTNVGDIVGNSKLTIDGDILGKLKLTTYGAISGASTLVVDNAITGESTITSWGALSSASTLTVDGAITGKSTLTTDGAITGETTITSYGALSSASTLTVDSTITGKAGLTLTGDIAVNGGDVTTTSTGTATLFNTNATTLNIGGAATTVSLGAGSGTTTVNNAVVGKSTITSYGALSAAGTNPVYASMLNTNSTGFTVADVVNFNLLGTVNTNSSDMFTVPTGYKFIPLDFKILITTATASYVSGSATFQLVDGSNNALTNAITINSGQTVDNILSSTGPIKAAASGSAIRVRITAQSLSVTGSPPTLTATAVVAGYLVQ